MGAENQWAYTNWGNEYGWGTQHSKCHTHDPNLVLGLSGVLVQAVWDTHIAGVGK